MPLIPEEQDLTSLNKDNVDNTSSKLHNGDPMLDSNPVVPSINTSTKQDQTINPSTHEKTTSTPLRSEGPRNTYRKAHTAKDTSRKILIEVAHRNLDNDL